MDKILSAGVSQAGAVHDTASSVALVDLWDGVREAADTWGFRGQQTQLSTDAFGRRTSDEDSDWKATTYTFNAMNQVTSERAAGLGMRTYAYDASRSPGQPRIETPGRPRGGPGGQWSLSLESCVAAGTTLLVPRIVQDTRIRDVALPDRPGRSACGRIEI
jgi:hypothetical protein